VLNGKVPKPKYHIRDWLETREKHVWHMRVLLCVSTIHYQRVQLQLQ